MVVRMLSASRTEAAAGTMSKYAAGKALNGIYISWCVQEKAAR